MYNAFMTKISIDPYRGARDFYPEEKRLQNYIFNVWRETALEFGYEEYDFPFLERYELYEAKSGEELVKRQLYSFEDRGGRKVAIRPEKTPSLARMIAAKIHSLPKPIRWFNIGNCWRYEKPQKGRGREFYQFDCDIFGIEDVSADVEVFTIPVEVMKKLGATKDMFEIKVANRKLAEYYLKEELGIKGAMDKRDTQMNKITKIVDTKTKISDEEFQLKLEKVGLTVSQINGLLDFLEADLNFIQNFKEKSEGAKETLRFFNLIRMTGYEDYFKFDPKIMRQFDYSTGIVIEQFDLNPNNNRAMFGGERYDDLVNLFSDEKLTGTGFAMGDITLTEFLKGWNLLPNISQNIDYFVTVWPDDPKNVFLAKSLDVSRKLRERGKSVICSLEKGVSISQQLSDANKIDADKAVIIGEQELKEEVFSVKDLKTGTQEKKIIKDIQ